MARFLDRLYDFAGWLAAIAILIICCVVSAQIGLNILARIGGPAWSWTIPSYADFAGFALAAASFLALAHTLRRGGHIRVNLVTDRLPSPARWAMELLTLALSTLMSGYATYYVILLVMESVHYGDQSTGIIAVPLWIPQLPVAIGLVLLTIALIHTLAESVIARAPVLTADTTEE